MMRHRFVAFILTHGRADRVYTFDSLKKAGYTGRTIFVVDNEDPTVEAYRERFGTENVYVFDKSEVARRVDEGDNFDDRRAILYARNVCFDIAEELGYELFIELDDDYVDFRHKRDPRGSYIHRADIRDLDAVFDAMIDYFERVPNLLSIAMAQGGDFIGGKDGGWHKAKRKCMNSFICSTRRRFKFAGRMNDDVNSYCALGSRGGLFLTTPFVALQQKATQANAGGMSEIYRSSGTYVKSFYSVMFQPSSVRISVMNTVNPRIHHKVRWKNTVPCILPESFRKQRDARKEKRS